ncbi:hypothetical protein GTO82_07605 [Lactobacillus johnsonii]|uniref:Zinc finger GAGA-binding factor domain-containing protein n=1 Tax=Lactobacillus johnsonii TaxID=33959 RepID=A0A9X7Y6W6_LACJH|nr:hypothetical protein GTO82_07605 [Lactobacillus johnsonii]
MSTCPICYRIIRYFRNKRSAIYIIRNYTFCICI